MSNTAYAIYASAWVCRLLLFNEASLRFCKDTLVDWSLMQSQSTNRFLRDELVYPYHTFVSANCLWPVLVYINKLGLVLFCYSKLAGDARRPRHRLCLTDLKLCSTVHVGNVYTTKRTRLQDTIVHRCMSRDAATMAMGPA